jgi:hypothetical protein
MGRDGIRRLATSVPERSSSGANTKHWQLNPGVYETGPSPKAIEGAARLAHRGFAVGGKRSCHRMRTLICR